MSFTPLHTLAADERPDCLADLQNVRDGQSATVFVARWRRQLEGFLASTELDDALDRAETTDQEAGDVEAEARRMADWIEDLADQLSSIADEVFDLGKRGEAQAAKLQKIIETAYALLESQAPVKP